MITGGNEFGFLPQLGRLDGSFGDVLLNDRKGRFYCADQKQTGIEFRGQVREIASVQVSSSGCFVFLQNNEHPSLYRARTFQNNTVLK
jgi:hypothetical protein